MYGGMPAEKASTSHKIGVTCKKKNKTMSRKMQKIRNFNQILLSVAGVIGILFLLVACVVFVIDFWPRDFKEEGMIVTDEAENLNEKGLRKEIISFDNFQVADSVNQIFILPVTQASLGNVESSDKSLGLMNSFSGKYYGELIYNNIVVYYGKLDSTVIVFKNRLSLGDYMVTQQGSHKFLLATGCDTDTNKDNFLNSKDLQKLYAYDLSAKNLNKLKLNQIILQYEHMNLKEQIL